jgi:hypothetical protein
MSDQFPLLSYVGAWRNVSNGSVPGAIVSDDLADPDPNSTVDWVDWTGGTITAVFKTQYTFTRPIVGFERATGTIKYAPVPQGPGEGSRLWGRFWLSGVASALDAPGEWHFVPEPMALAAPSSADGPSELANVTRGKLYYYPLGRGTEAGGSKAAETEDAGTAREEVPSHAAPLLLAKGLDYAIVSVGIKGTKFNTANVRLEDFDMQGATVHMDECDNCSATNIAVDFPSFQAEIPEMGAVKGQKAVYTLFAGNGIEVRNMSIRHTPEIGLFVLGRGALIDNVLIEDQVRSSGAATLHSI